MNATKSIEYRDISEKVFNAYEIIIIKDFMSEEDIKRFQENKKRIMVDGARDVCGKLLRDRNDEFIPIYEKPFPVIEDVPNIKYLTLKKPNYRIISFMVLESGQSFSEIVVNSSSDPMEQINEQSVYTQLDIKLDDYCLGRENAKNSLYDDEKKAWDILILKVVEAIKEKGYLVANFAGINYVNIQQNI